jgi:hypothetical protein
MPFQPGAFLRDLRDLSGWKLRAFFALYYTYVGFWLTLSTRVRLGTHVFDEEWDLLIVLDTCRVDALEAVADEYEFIGEVNAITSLGSSSVEWLSQTFDADYRDHIALTAYVTSKWDTDKLFREGNYPPDVLHPPAVWPDWNVVSADDFGLLSEVWRETRDDRLGVTPPRPVTDRTIEVARDGDCEQVVAHYMQPHSPYISGHVDGTDPLSSADIEPFAALKRGATDRATVWTRYLDNLRLVLDDVARLLEHVDADRVVITADHGEGFGEYGVYGHPVGCPVPTIKRVPWVVTTATDTGSHPTDADVTDSETSGESPTERLTQDGGVSDDPAENGRDDSDG